jgi:putative transposase
MARPLRVEFAGACYHVINRGNFRSPIFREERDREMILDRLVDFAERFEVRIRAYCLQINHFHCYLQTTEANLGRFMQSFLTSFSISYNCRHRTSGHVFQGRYKAFLVEDDSVYAAEVSRYIHLNSVRIPSLEGAAVATLQREARQCRWSSYGAVIGLRRCPRWLKREDILRGWGGTLKERQLAYAKYVEQGLTKDLWDPWESAAAQAVIGSDSFVDKIRRGLTDMTENLNLRSASAEQRKLLAWCSLEDVKTAVAEEYGCDEQYLLRRWSHSNEARQVLLYLAGTYCRGRYTLTKLGSELGDITVGGLSRARSLMGERISHSEDLAARVSAIEERLRGNKS